MPLAQPKMPASASSPATVDPRGVDSSAEGHAASHSLCWAWQERQTIDFIGVHLPSAANASACVCVRTCYFSGLQLQIFPGITDFFHYICVQRKFLNPCPTFAFLSISSLIFPKTLTYRQSI